MKKYLSIILFCSCLISASAQELVNGIYYQVDDVTKTAEVVAAPESVGKQYYQGKITIPSSVQIRGQEYPVASIGLMAFKSTDITEITLPSSITDICYSAFSHCTNLTSINLPEGVTHIWDYAFSHCTGLTEISFPEGLIEIDNFSFSGCSSLQEVVFPESLEQLFFYAFKDCIGIKSITLPANLTFFSTGAFEFCYNMTELTYLARRAENGASGFLPMTLTKVTIGDEVEVLPYGLFANCCSLTSICIPPSVTEIGEMAFYYCDNLREVHCLNPIPPSGESFFNFDNEDEIPDGCTLYVPIGSKDLYAASEGWKGFPAIVEEDATQHLSAVGSSSSVAGRCYMLDGRLSSDGACGICVVDGKKVMK